jgi:hypothetical protein
MDDAPEDKPFDGQIIPPRDDKPWLWKKGQSGNPKGRTLGNRMRLSYEYIGDLHDLWKRRGSEILERTADTHPQAIVKAISSIIPRELLVKAETSEISRDDIVRLLEDVRAARAASIREAAGGDAPPGGPEETPGGESK